MLCGERSTNFLAKKQMRSNCVLRSTIQDQLIDKQRATPSSNERSK